MPTTRRDFLKRGAAAPVVGPRLLSATEHAPLVTAPGADTYVLDLAAEALGAAKDAGAIRRRPHRPLSLAIRQHPGAPHHRRR